MIILEVLGEKSLKSQGIWIHKLVTEKFLLKSTYKIEKKTLIKTLTNKISHGIDGLRVEFVKTHFLNKVAFEYHI